MIEIFFLILNKKIFYISRFLYFITITNIRFIFIYWIFIMYIFVNLVFQFFFSNSVNHHYIAKDKGFTSLFKYNFLNDYQNYQIFKSRGINITSITSIHHMDINRRVDSNNKLIFFYWSSRIIGGRHAIISPYFMKRSLARDP